MKGSRAALGLLPVLGLLVAGLVVMWPLAASTVDALLGTHLVGRAYDAQHVRMVQTPQVLPPADVSRDRVMTQHFPSEKESPGADRSAPRP